MSDASRGVSDSAVTHMLFGWEARGQNPWATGIYIINELKPEQNLNLFLVRETVRQADHIDSTLLTSSCDHLVYSIPFSDVLKF